MSKKYNKKDIGQKIKIIRLKKGMTLEEFGKLFNTSKGIVSRWENGISTPTPERLKKIAELGGVSVAYITGVSDYKGVDEYWEEVAKTNILEADILNAVDTIGEKRLTDVYLFFEKELRKEYLKTISDNKKYQIDEYIKTGLKNIKTMLWELPDNIVKLLLYWSLLDENDRTHLFEIVKSLSNKTIDN